MRLPCGISQRAQPRTQTHPTRPANIKRLSQECKHAASGKKPLKTAIAFAKADPETRKGLQKFDDEELSDVEAFLKIIPDVEIDLNVAVNDEEQIAESDLITLEMTLTRHNVTDGEEVGLVHSPNFPFVKKESWWLRAA